MKGGWGERKIFPPFYLRASMFHFLVCSRAEEVSPPSDPRTSAWSRMDPLSPVMIKQTHRTQTHPPAWGSSTWTCRVSPGQCQDRQEHQASTGATTEQNLQHEMEICLQLGLEVGLHHKILSICCSSCKSLYSGQNSFCAHHSFSGETKLFMDSNYRKNPKRRNLPFVLL